MELVDDHDVEVRGVDRFESGPVEALDRREDVFESRRPLSADPELAEARVTKGVCECCAALFEDLLAVRDEEEPVSRQPFAKARVVDGGHDRLAGTGRGDEEVAVPAKGARELDLLQAAVPGTEAARSRPD